MTEKALLIIEGPWWTPREKPSRPSVFPFLQGLRNYSGKFNMYHSNFYEKQGFKRALQDDLVHAHEDRLFLYISAHGTSRTIGGLKSKTGMQISTFLKTVNRTANYSNIEGLVIGSCTVCNNVDDLIAAVKSSSIVWIFGYNCDIHWIPSTFVDVSVFEHLLDLEKGDLRKRDEILGAFVLALKRFNGDYVICKSNGEEIALRDAITLVIQPRGRGSRPINETARLIERLGWKKE